jgi:two-component system OmpR family sensor kinase
MEWDEHGPFQAVFGDPATHVWTLDEEGAVARANDRAQSLSGGDPTDRRLSAAVEWTTPREVRDRVDRALSGSFDRGTARADAGETLVLDLAVRPVVAEGDVDGVVVGGRDVTDRVRDRRALADQREKMAALHDVATELVCCEEPTTVYERTIAAAEEVLDLSLCFVGVVEGDRIVPSAHSRDEPRHVNVLSTDHGLAGETLRTGESQLVVDTTDPGNAAEPVRDTYRSGISVPVGDDAIFQAVATERGAFDETDLELVETLTAHAAESARRARSERTLRRQNERLEEFASVVAHDLRNPLSSIRANAQLARETGDEEAVEAIVSSADRMEGLVSELLELSRAGEVVDEPELVSLRRVAHQAWSSVDAPTATLAVEGDRELSADPPRLRRLLENLLANAVEHGSTSPRQAEDAVEQGSTSPRQAEDAVEQGSTSPEQAPDAVEQGSTSSRPQADDAATHGGEDVTVRVGPLAGGFFVGDDGRGVPRAERDAVFEQGYTTTDGGTGFGLAIVREIAEAHGWSVDLVESAEGGARFEFTGV